MPAPDFSRIAKIALPWLKKDGLHTLIIFSVIGVAIIVYGFFNPENRTGLILGGIFFLCIGVVRYGVEKYKKPHLTVALITKKEAIPYSRISGTFDYFIQIETVSDYQFSLHGQFEEMVIRAEESRLKVSEQVFKVLIEGRQSMILFSSTRTLLGVFTDEYEFLDN